MKIAIAGGDNKADFLITMLQSKKHKLVVINEDSEICEKQSEEHGMAIFNGDPCKHFILDEAGIKNFDIMIALTDRDADNLQICQSAKKMFNVKKTISVVSDPKNVEIFKQLGVNTAISSAYMIANAIEMASTLESLVKTLSLEEEKIVFTEIVVEKTAVNLINKRIMDIKFPDEIIISCILREGAMIVPNGKTIILEGDKLLFISSPENQKKVIAAFNKRS
jgi:trk system potassium uptake protein TrkA